MENNKNTILYEDTLSERIGKMNSLTDMLFKTPHYSKLGIEGIYAIVSAARVLDIDPFTALDGGMYFVKGKVEMTARLMNAKIRQHKHSITQDKRSDSTICILHGKRSDTGDTLSASFTIEEARHAGLLRSVPWQNYPVDMLFARALSRLARRLFPDVIGNTYVQGEISCDPYISLDGSEITKQESQPQFFQDEQQVVCLSEEQCENLKLILQEDNEIANNIKKTLEEKQITDLKNVPVKWYTRIIALSKENTKNE